MKKIKTLRVFSLFMALLLLFACFSIPVNARSYCSITVQDEEDNSAIQNSVFIIRDSSGNTLSFKYSDGYYTWDESVASKELKTNVAGKILMENLPDGEYTAIQKSIPDKYNSDLKTKKFNTNNNSDIVITNGRKYGALAIKVVDSMDSSKQISNIGFSLKDSSGNLLNFTKSNSTYTYTSNSTSSATTKLYSTSGRIDIYKIPIGKYTLIQNTTDSKYNVQSETDIVVDNTRNTQKIITIKNSQKSGNVSIKNSVSGTATYNILSGNTVLKFSKSSDGNYTYDIKGNVSDLKTSDGKLLVANLPQGSYAIKAVSAPSGYSSNNYTKNISVVINKTSDVTFSFTKVNANQPVSKDGKIHVMDENNNNLPGVGIAITNENGGTIKTIKSDSSGNVSLSDLKEGKYSFAVSSVPDGYVLDTNTKYSFIINKDGTVSDVPIVTVKNIAIYVQHPDKVKDIEFTLYNDYNEKVLSVKTNDDGLAVFKNIIPGSYTIKQTGAPEGYVVSKTVKTLIISNSFNNGDSPLQFNNSSTTETTQPATDVQSETGPQLVITPNEPETEDINESNTAETEPTPSEPSNNGWIVWVVIGCIIVGGVLGASLAIIVNKRKARKEEEEMYSSVDDSEYEIKDNSGENNDDLVEHISSMNEDSSSDSLDIDTPVNMSQEEIEQHVGLLENIVVKDDDGEDIEMHKQIDSEYGIDVGEYEDEGVAIIDKNEFEIDTENSDVGEIDNTVVKTDDGPNEIEKTIDGLYGADTGVLKEENNTFDEQSHKFNFDTAKEDVGLLDSAPQNDNSEKESEKEKNIDDIYGTDVGVLTPSTPEPKKQNTQTPHNHKKNKKKKKKK